ncbi:MULTISPECIES: hypothetical protein [Weissella]|uniref:hypothetical protein n=1 Tax=Weissella TaxID=46255 RepID=UPI0002192354|nr:MULTISPECIES: hypothetical protein [Weissella]APS26898.1 hypothetical protein AUC63_00855 [Weissella cibaria]APU62295.1 hypothetical protein AUC65_00460 [Weissella cibaria]APU64447.1 hypothetical protein AUC62_00454 [Weissella cibaria]ASS52171.1 hypothetical protein CHR48_01234 [Weissella cibaria]KXU09965.1 hypothetical protein WEIDD23_00569 [Weissella sp. DD23]
MSAIVTLFVVTVVVWIALMTTRKKQTKFWTLLDILFGVMLVLWLVVLVKLNA